MGDLDKYFDTPNKESSHPKIRSWRKRIEAGEKAECELYRKFDGLTYGVAKLYVSFRDEADKELKHDEVEWEPELNEELMRLHVRASGEENEGRRLALMLKTWFARPESRYGDGFFSSVLYEYLQNSDLGRQQVVRDVLRQIHENAPYKESPSYDDCVESIEGVIVKAARSLRVDLTYPLGKAKSILAQAIAYYLEERFSIAQRRMMGLG